MEIVGYSIAVFCIYLAVRNQWVYNWQIKITKAVYKFRMDIVNSWKDISLEEYEKSKQYFESLPEYEVMCNSFDSYLTMMLMFWIWDYKKFINNKQVFCMFYPCDKTTDTTCECNCGCG